MLNLKLKKLDVQKLPFEPRGLSQLIEHDFSIVALDNTNVVFHQNYMAPGETINSSSVEQITWNFFENVIYMYTGSQLECYDVRNRSTTVIDVLFRIDCFNWNRQQDRLACVNSSGDLLVVQISPARDQLNILHQTKIPSVKPVTPDLSAAGDFSGVIDVNPYIAWEPQDQAIALSIIMEEKRRLILCDERCVPLWSMEVNFCSPHLSWRPHANQITICQSLDDSPTIKFIEKNNEVAPDTIVLNRFMNVVKFEWNKEGDVLFVLQEDKVAGSFVSLYSCLNDTWLVKQTLWYGSEIEGIKDIYWSSTVMDKIALILITNAHITQYVWYWGSDASRWTENNALNLIPTINDQSVELVRANENMVPPPENELALMFEEPVNFVKFSVDGQSLLVVANNNNCSIFNLNDMNLTAHYFHVNDSIVPYSKVPLSYNNFILENENKIYLVEVKPDNNTVYIFYVHYGESDNIEVNATNLYTSKNTINALELHNGDLYILTEQELVQIHEGNPTKLFNPHSQGIMQIISVDKSDYIFQLDSMKLYINNELIRDDVMSLNFCQEYIVLICDTTIYFYKISSRGLELLKNKNLREVFTRTMPKGSHFVSTIPDSRALIIQTPTGELEILKPRVFSISVILKLIADKNYVKALDIVRVDRINPNILVDVNPQQFLDNLNEFINGVHNCDELNFFITNLLDQNVTQEIYAKCFEHKLPSATNFKKCEEVFNRMLEIMKLDKKHYIYSIITIHVSKKTEEGLAEALQELEWVIDQEISGEKLPMTSESLYKRIEGETANETIYNTCLYKENFRMMQWICRHCQEDPLIYIPFFNELNDYTPHYRSYRIAHHLRKYEEAFIHLIECPDVEEELLNFVKKNNLYGIILKNVKESNQWFEMLMTCLIKHLTYNRHYNEAGFVCKKVKNYDNALNSYVEAGNLAAVLDIIQILSQENERSFDENYQQLAQRLIECKKIMDASFVFETCLKKHEESLKLLLQEKFWTEAFYLARRHNRKDVIDSDIKNSLVTYKSELSSIIEAKENDIIKYRERLNVVRANQIQEMGDSANYTNNQQPDFDLENFALAPSVAGSVRSSQRSTSTSRRKKKVERKVVQLKEGSMFEHLALMRQLYLLITETYTYAESVRETSMALINFDDIFVEAESLQTQYRQILRTIDYSIGIIWSDEFLNPTQPMTKDALAIRVFIEELDPKYRIPPASLAVQWEVPVILAQKI